MCKIVQMGGACGAAGGEEQGRDEQLEQIQVMEIPESSPPDVNVWWILDVW